MLCAGKNIKRLRERFDIDTAEMFADQGLLVVTCTEANLPQAQKLIDHVKESLRELQVGDVFKATKVCSHLHILAAGQHTPVMRCTVLGVLSASTVFRTALLIPVAESRVRFSKSVCTVVSDDEFRICSWLVW